MPQNKKRFEWIDIAKGIGVLLVFLGHESLPYQLKVGFTHFTCLYSLFFRVILSSKETT